MFFLRVIAATPNIHKTVRVWHCVGAYNMSASLGRRTLPVLDGVARTAAALTRSASGFLRGSTPQLPELKPAGKLPEWKVGWLVEWGFYALSASKAIFRARTYNCNLFSPVTTWWMKLGGNRPPGDNPLLFSTSGTGSFIVLDHRPKVNVKIPTNVKQPTHVEEIGHKCKNQRQMLKGQLHI